MYNLLKLLHIISATGLLTGMALCVRAWIMTGHSVACLPRVQLYTLVLILPCAFFQLATGFTMISLGHYPFTPAWAIGSASGFVIAMTTWFGFVYSLLLPTYSRRLSSILLAIVVFTIIIMIFFMANKI